MKIYDELGSEIVTLFSEITEAGKVYEIEFSAKGGSASGGDAYTLSSGVYYYRLSMPNKSLFRKMMLLR